MRGRLRLALAAGSACCGLIAAPSFAQATTPYTAYVSNEGSESLTPISTATNLTGSTIASSSPSVIAITPDGKTALVVSGTANTVTPITLATGAAASPITVGTDPVGIAITPDGKTAYAADAGSNKVTPITLATDLPGAAIAVGTDPMGVAITPDGTEVYVTNRGSNTVTPIAVAGNAPGAAINVGSEPEGVAISPDGTTVYVAEHGSESVMPITVATNLAGSAIKVRKEPIDVAITPDGTTAYVTNEGDNSVSPIALTSGTVGSPISVGSHPVGIAISPDGATAYVANRSSKTVTPITVATNTAAAAINVGEAPDTVAVTPDEAPVASFTAGTVTAGTPSSFNASASSVAYGTISSYYWSFGDGSTSSTTSPAIKHTYAAAGNYTATVTETDSAGTSTTQVFTGQTVSRNGGSAAQASLSVSVTQPAQSPPSPTGDPRGAGDPPASEPAAVRPTPPVVSAGSLTVSNQGVALIPVSCPASATGGCHGKITITVHVAETRRRARASRCARGCRPLGTASYEARAGQKVRVRVHIASFGRRLLAGHPSVRVTLTATSVSGAQTATVSRAIALRSAARA